ncbi:allantoate deiminase [Kineococcus radiotolerans]|uniref:Allantoate deiminase n=1 Tax=Kineococcus radiotolerans TaxID=131568 RepID=A0A7W4TI33_KINRA|nr:allantoate amidohydrolase [Kineococcus radiotolerans]MBB2899317.1 allantoate deiminase [Kineococcus radiotolerans]
MSTSDARRDAQRVLDRCDELATVSALEGGVERVHLSPEHARANEVAARWMAGAGMRTWRDQAGNQWGRLEGNAPGLPALVLGSHLDTVTDAGRYDGVLGVLTAIEVAGRLAPRAAELPFALEVVAFSDEEGTRFSTALMGSSAVAGAWREEWWDRADDAGTTVREAAAAFGLDPARIAEAARRPEDLVGYLELHIEQGPHLEAADRPLGVVTSIAGARRFTGRVVGEARHAGGTPYPKRRDALVGASEVVLAVERLAVERGGIATVGRLQAHPGGVNVVPGLVEFSLDVRAEHDGERDALVEAIAADARRLCTARGLGFELDETHCAAGVYCDADLSASVVAGIAATGDADPLRIWSRAGHDAMAVAAITPVAMVFVRCADGISHAPAESVTPSDVATGLDALEAAVLDVATRRAATHRP